MTKINREDIQVISRHSNLLQQDIDKLLKEQIYSNRDSWVQFLKLLFISLGVGFTAFGILFFFAYNWADLHKFIKIGLIEAVIVTITGVVLFSKLSTVNKNILLTGTALIVGVLFAVFGQIYQTGANAYDFFQGWTMFITLWVLISNFAPLWLIYITLINTTLILYSEQVAHEWSTLFLFMLLFILNASFLLLFLYGQRKYDQVKVPTWFTHVLALATITFATQGIVYGVFETHRNFFVPMLVMTIVLYVLGIRFGLRQKSGFYLAIIPFSVIIIISAFLIRLSDDAGMFLLVSLFVVGSVSFVIYNLINLQKKWTK